MTAPDVLSDVAEAIKASLDGTIDGVRRFYTEPPSVINEWPALLVYHIRGDWSLETAYGSNALPVIWGMQTFAVSVAIPYKDLRRDVAALRPLVNPITVALWKAGLDHRFSGTIVGLGNLATKSKAPPIRSEIDAADWAGTDKIGYRFEVDVTVAQEVV